MKKIIPQTLLLLALLAAGPCHAAFDENFTTGKDWVKRMSPKEKYISLIPPTLLFAQYDVKLRHSLPQYIGLLDQILLRNPQLEAEGVENIFASAIYLFEPENREQLRTLETNFLRGELENKPLHAPRLTIEEVLKEISA